MTGQLKLTSGFNPFTLVNPFGPDGQSILTRLLSHAPASSDPDDYDLVSVANYEDTIGEISLYQLPDGSGINVTITPTFPDNYAHLYFVLRGRFEYKTNTASDGVVVLYSDVSVSPVEVTFLDTDYAETEENAFYYYSILALVGGVDGEPLHFEYNPTTGFASAFRYKTDYGYATGMINRLPPNWFTQENSDIEGLINVFGGVFETLRSDLETYMFASNSPENIEESHLPVLASILGWSLDRGQPARAQRRELPVVTALYRRKGRDRAIEFLLQALTGWDLSFEYGYRHLISFGGGIDVFNPTDTRRLSLIGVPELRVEDQIIGTSDASPDQTFYVNQYARDIHIEVYEGDDYEAWEEVDDFTGSGPDDQHFVVATDGSGTTTVTFGDGVNGAIPADTTDIVATYFYGGDEYKYPPTNNTWLSPNGTRVILTETSTSQPITEAMVRRIREVVDRFKASYAIYDFVIQYAPIVELAPTAEDSYEDEIEAFTFLQYNEEDHQRNTPPYIRP